jgi:hypothetical protein
MEQESQLPIGNPLASQHVVFTHPAIARAFGKSGPVLKMPSTKGEIVLEAQLSQRQVRNIFVDTGDKYPEIMTYEQAAEMVSVSVSTLKGWFCEGRYANCVRRGKPGRVLRDTFLKEFMKDDFG